MEGDEVVDCKTVDLTDGNIVHIDGLPFEVVGSARVRSHAANVEEISKRG
jgi:hypothetical protein